MAMKTWRMGRSCRLAGPHAAVPLASNARMCVAARTGRRSARLAGRPTCVDLPTRFKQFLEQIRPTPIHINQLRRGHTTLRRLLSRDPMLRPHIVTSFLQGSYRRATAVRSVDGGIGADVDIVLVTDLDPRRNSPDAVMDRLKPFLFRHYPAWRMQGRSLRVEVDEVALDVVLTSAPSRVDLLRQEAGAEPLDAGHQPTPAELAAWQTEPLRIPDRDRRQWCDTHPLAQLAATRAKNARCNGHFINVVKAIKWWKAVTPGCPEHPKSYPLERLVEIHCPDDITSVADGVTRTLESIAGGYASGHKPVLNAPWVRGQDVLARVPPADFAAFVARVAAAAKLARQALDCEDEEESAALWRRLFGPAFPAAAGIHVVPRTPVVGPSWSLQDVAQTLAERGQMIATGFDQLARIKRIIEQAVQELGLRIVVDPDTPPELKDYFGVMLLTSLQGGLAGAGLGVVAGAIFGRPREFMTFGAVVGALLGAGKGHTRVKAGWRLRSGYDERGEVFVELRLLP